MYSTDSCCQWFMGLGFTILAFGSAITAFMTKGDNCRTPSLLAHLNLLVLFQLLPPFGRAMQRHTKVKVAVWLFATSLTTILTWPATVTMPLLGKIMAWIMVVATSVGGFYVFFLSKPRSSCYGHNHSIICFFFLFVLFLSLTVTYRGPRVNFNPTVEQIEFEMFEIVTCLDSLLLFWSVCLMEIIPLNSANKERMKFAVWGFATALIFMVVSQLVQIFPLPMEIVAWVMAAASSLSGFYGFFVQSESCRPAEADYATRNFPWVNVL